MQDTRPFVLRGESSQLQSKLWMKADGLFSTEPAEAATFARRADAYAFARSKGYSDFAMRGINAVRKPVGLNGRYL